MIKSSDINEQKYALNTLMSRYKADNNTPNEFKGGGSTKSEAGMYRDMAQFMQDVSKPEYRNDPVFRKQVEAKLAKSRKAGLIQ